MGKSTSGPDWTDITCYAVEMRQQTGAELMLIITLDGSAGGLPLSVVALAAKQGASPWEVGEAVSVSTSFPNKANKSFEGAVFAALFKLDAEVRKAELLDIILPQ